MKYSTSNSLLKVWVIVIFLATITPCCVHIHAEWIVTPENLALVVGQRGVLNCASNKTTTDGIAWFYAQTGVPSLIIRCNSDPNSDPVYSFESPTTDSCNLIILNVTVDQAGLYQCRAATAEEELVHAQLIVLESTPQCSTQPTDSMRVDETVTMSCSVRYHGAVGPNMTWYDPENSELPSINQGPILVSNYTTSVTANIPAVLPHTCKTLFTVAPPPPILGDAGRYADNPPRYTSECQTKDLIVQYPPYADNITITPDTSGDLYPGYALTCNATTEPAVNFYQWFNETGAPMVNDTRLVLDEIGENLTYICTVANQLGQNSAQIVINVIPVPVPTVTTISTRTSDLITVDSTVKVQSSTASDKPDECKCSSDCVGLGIGLGIPLAISLLFNGLGIALYAYKYRNPEVVRTSVKRPEKESFEDVTVSSSDAVRNQSAGIDHTSQYEKLHTHDNQPPVVYEQLPVNSADNEYDKR